LSKGTKPTTDYIYAALKQIDDGSNHIQRALRNPELRFLKSQIDGVVTDEKKAVEIMSKTLGSLYQDLGMFPTVSFDRLAILRRDIEDVDRALPPFNEWIAESSSKIQAKSTEVREWRP
jgi:hypothetical protein